MIVDFDSMLDGWSKKGNDPRWAIGKECWEYIERELSEKDDDHRQCFEFGCGLSSVLFRQCWYCRGHSIFEDKEQWLRTLNKQYPMYEFPVSLCYIPIVNGQWQYGMGMELFNINYDHNIDVCLIDGPSGTSNRDCCIPYVESMMRHGGLIIVDDVNRKAELQLALLLAHKMDGNCVVHDTTYNRQFAAIHLPE